MNRTALVERTTKETNITCTLNLDGSGKQDIQTPVGFLTHMLDVFSFQGLFDLTLKAQGDIQVDEHHIVEDIGIILGQTVLKALEDKRGITRYGFFIVPMDESIATVAIDFSGRSTFRLDCGFKREKVGDLSTELVYDFWDAFAQNARCNLFIKVEYGRNDHHQIEAIFKATGRALQMAVQTDKRRGNSIPSTKGVL